MCVAQLYNKLRYPPLRQQYFIQREKKTVGEKEITGGSELGTPKGVGFWYGSALGTLYTTVMKGTDPDLDVHIPSLFFLQIDLNSAT